jgi:hypothetical protein
MYHICWNKQNNQATSFVSKPCCTSFMTLLQRLSLSCDTNITGMFQCMENTCCIYMLHQPYFISNQSWNKHIGVCCILMFQAKQCINEMNDAPAYEMQVQIWEPNTCCIIALPLLVPSLILLRTIVVVANVVHILLGFRTIVPWMSSVATHFTRHTSQVIREPLMCMTSFFSLT